MGRLKAKGIEIEQSPISMKGVALSADLVESGAISGKMLKDLYDLVLRAQPGFPRRLRRRGAASNHATRRRWKRSSTRSSQRNPKQVEQYRAGKKTVIGFFVGQVMKASKGQANPQLVNELLAKKLGA